jgi:hypothetical protein
VFIDFLRGGKVKTQGVAAGLKEKELVTRASITFHKAARIMRLSRKIGFTREPNERREKSRSFRALRCFRMFRVLP